MFKISKLVTKNNPYLMPLYAILSYTTALKEIENFEKQRNPWSDMHRNLTNTILYLGVTKC